MSPETQDSGSFLNLFTKNDEASRERSPFWNLFTAVDAPPSSAQGEVGPRAMPCALMFQSGFIF